MAICQAGPARGVDYPPAAGLLPTSNPRPLSPRLGSPAPRPIDAVAVRIRPAQPRTAPSSSVPSSSAAAAELASAAEPAALPEFASNAFYDYVGEYVTSVDHRLGPRHAVGLQVTLAPGGSLRGRLYPGGLPGTGFTRGDVELVQEFSESFSPDAPPSLIGPGGFRVQLASERAEAANPRGVRADLRRVERISQTMGLQPPPGAVVLFDGGDTGRLIDAKINADGTLAHGTETVDPFPACYLHAEFRVPLMPDKLGQARGNSGLYLQRRYEIQILDSFADSPIENGCGSIYRQRPPSVNMSLPPTVWQTYDIYFVPPTFDAAGEKRLPARITVIHNGVPVHWQQEITAKTGAGRPEGTDPLPLYLQDHGDPVDFRNVWYVPIDPAQARRMLTP